MSLTLIELVRKSLAEIDDELRKEGVEIFRRPLHALMKLGRKFPQLDGMSMLPIENPRNDLEAVPGEVGAWYEAQYGDRLKFDPSVGAYPILIRGEPWRARFPLVFGQVRIFCDPDLSVSCGKAEINILGKIDGLGQGLASSLSDQEITEIGEEYLLAMNILTSLSSHGAKGMLEPALTDYNAAIENLFARNPHDGQCKWSALQFAEKAMKQRLVELGETPKFTHDLQKLADALLTHGIQVDAKLIGDVQCEAGVRYGQPQVSRLEAVTAVQSALRIYAGLFSPDAFEFSNQPHA